MGRSDGQELKDQWRDPLKKTLTVNLVPCDCLSFFHFLLVAHQAFNSGFPLFKTPNFW